MNSNAPLVINLLAVTLATLSTLIVDAVWYSPKVFGTVWGRLAKVKPTGEAKNAIRPIVLTVIVSFMTSWVLANFAYLSYAYWGGSFVVETFLTALLLWFGFTAARLLTHDLVENRPWKLSAVNLAHEFVTIMVMAAIIGLMAPVLPNAVGCINGLC